MADNTHIQWAEASWNPIRAKNVKTGESGTFCVRVSGGCTNCYASDINEYRFGNGLEYTAQNLRHVEFSLSTSGQTAIDWPIRTKKPRRIFVCSMTDLFGEFHSDVMIDRVFATMGAAPQHVFQVLTKRAARMQEYIRTRGHRTYILRRLETEVYPPPNVWLGVSVEDQKTADERIPLLLNTPARIRWISYEPALGPVAFESIRAEDKPVDGVYRADLPGRIDWCVVGGESGNGARPFNLEWARQTVKQCRESGVACFVKQIGSFPTVSQIGGAYWNGRIFVDGAIALKAKDRKGGDMSEWPEDLQIREYPTLTTV